MRTLTNLALTAAVALYLLFVVAGLVCLASVLPGPLALLTIPLGSWNGFMASDLIGQIWDLEGQYDDEAAA